MFALTILATTTLALANPASVYCVQQGGRVEIVRTPKGEAGYCVLPDGRRIEEWKLFRSNAPRPRG